MSRPLSFDENVAVSRAMQLFWRKGYRGTTPQDLVEAVGIGKGSLYNTFGSKRELFGRALERYRDEQAVLVDEALSAPGPIKERVAAAFALLIDANFADADRRGCLAVNTAAELAGSDVDAANQVRAMFERTRSVFLAAIHSGQASGELRTDLDAEALATHLLTTLVGLQLLSKTAIDADLLKRSVSIAVEAL